MVPMGIEVPSFFQVVNLYKSITTQFVEGDSQTKKNPNRMNQI